MRNLAKNKRPFYVLKYLGQTELVDKDGYMTGESSITYSTPILVMGNISGAKGSAYAEMFGTEIEYDKTIVISRKKYEEVGLDENSVMFVDKVPTYDTNNMPLYDYKIKKIADTLNEVAIAIEKVRR